MKRSTRSRSRATGSTNPASAEPAATSQTQLFLGRSRTMGLGDTKVGYEALDQAAADLKKGAVGLDNMLDDLERRLRGRQRERTDYHSPALDSSPLSCRRALHDVMHTPPPNARHAPLLLVATPTSASPTSAPTHPP